MTYKINGTELTLQPETGNWRDRESIGATGNGHQIYSSVREFEMRWGFMSMSEFNELHGLYSALGTTGTAVVELPEYAGSAWSFREYSGTVLQEPGASNFFEKHVSNVRLIVSKVKT